MNWILKNKNKKVKTFAIVLFLVFSFFLSTKISLAANTLSEPMCSCRGGTLGTDDKYFVVKDEAECTAAKSKFASQNPPVNYSTCIFRDIGGGGVPVNQDPKAKIVAENDSAFLTPFKYLLVGVFNFVGWIFAIAATLFAWVIEPANISAPGTGVLQKQAVKDVWIMVRDLLNMTFILVLLFAAFCTIFQVEKWNLKKVWLNVLINALLVNFSYPIARFFIDVSNVAFYYFVNNLFTATGTVTGSGIFAMFGASSGIGEILRPTDYNQYSIAYLLTMIIVVFIMGMTMLVIGALFVVRLVALTMLVMFSPIGFVGYIFPATASFADKWWKNLFSYSFFAPIMIFGMAIALKITEAIGKDNMQSFRTNASANSPVDQTNFIASAAFMVIPIVVLWTTIGVAKSMGIEGADKVVDMAKKGGKALAMMGPGNWAKKNWDGFSKARKSRQDEIDKKRFGGKWGKGLNQLQDTVIGKVPVLGKTAKSRATDMRQDENKEKIEKGAKGVLDGGATTDTLAQDVNGHFGGPAPTTRDAKIAQARHAAAYLKQDSDERKMHVQTTLQSSGGVVGSDIEHILNTPPPATITGTALASHVAAQGAATAAAARIATAHISGGPGGTPGVPNENDIRSVTSFINKQMKSQVEKGAKA